MLKKQALVEWLTEDMNDIDKHNMKDFYINLQELFDEIQSGAFDADENEIQRLRAALEMAQSELRWGDPANAIERVERIIDEALSTTTEPINAEKVERVREGDGNDA